MQKFLEGRKLVLWLRKIFLAGGKLLEMENPGNLSTGGNFSMFLKISHLLENFSKNKKLLCQKTKNFL